MTRGNSHHRNHNHSHHVGFIPAFVVSPQPCEPSYPDPISWMEKNPIPRTRVKESWGGGVLDPQDLLSALHLHPGMGFSEQPSSFSPRVGAGGRIYKRQNQREQLEAEAWKKPHRPPSQRRGLSVVRGSLAHSQV